MRKNQLGFIATFTAVVIFVISFFVAITVKKVNDKVTTYCFNQLYNTSKQLASDLYERIDLDRTVLSAMAGVIADEDNVSNQRLCEIISSYNTGSSYISYTELMSPDNMILDANGNITNASGKLSFLQDSVKGPYITNIDNGILDPEDKVFRIAVPVLKDQKAIYILYGVIRITDFMRKFTTDVYDGHAYLYIEDGDNGNMILDTQTKTTNTNMKDFAKFKPVSNFNFEIAESDLQQGIGGNYAYSSGNSGKTYYMHYEPIGFNNWNVIISIEHKYALHESDDINTSLYIMSGIIGGVMFVYIAAVSIYLILAYRQIQKLATGDQVTGAKNRTAYEQYIAKNFKRSFEKIGCIYIDANGLHEVNNKFGHAVGDRMLCIIADALNSQFDNKNVFRIGGDEFVVFCEDKDADTCEEKMKNVISAIELHEYTISYGIVCHSNELGLDRIIQEADEQMLDNKREFYNNRSRSERR